MVKKIEAKIGIGHQQSIKCCFEEKVRIAYAHKKKKKKENTRNSTVSGGRLPLNPRFQRPLISRIKKDVRVNVKA